VEVHDRAVPRAGAGQRVAASLVGLEHPARRGQALVTPAAFPSSFRLDVRLHALPGGRGVDHGAHVRALHGTADVEARVVLLESARLAPGESGLAQLRLRERVVAGRGDRLVVRLSAPVLTVAGGTVLDPAPKRHAADAATLARLELLERGTPADIVHARLATAAWPLPLAALAPPGLLDAQAATAAVDGLVAAGEVVAFAGEPATYLPAARYAAVRAALRERLAARAADDPLDPTLPLTRLIADGPGRDGLLARLVEDRALVREGPNVRAPGTRANAAAVHARATGALLAALDAGAFTPPDLPTLRADSGLDEREFGALLAALEREGALVRFGGDLAYTGARFAAAREAAVARCEAAGAITLAELRDALGASRRFAQGLLERLDADGVTRRVGDQRVLRRRVRAAAKPEP
jgi:selenocysteine-specific elongation factor